MDSQDSESHHEGAVSSNSSSSELKLQIENFKEGLKSTSKDIQYSMITDESYDHIFDLYKKWLEVLEGYQVTHHQYIQIIEEADKQSYLYDHIDFQREIATFRRYSEEWFELNKPTPTDVKPYDSVSQLNRSHSSSKNSNWVREEQKKIELVEKRKLLEQKQKLEIEKLQIKQKEEQIQLESDIAIAEAKSAVSLRAASHHSSSRSTSSRRQPQNVTQIPIESISIPTYSEGFNKTLIQSLKRPVVDIKKFGGDPSEYLCFVRQLNTQVFANCSTDEEKLNYLESFTYGQPNKIVRGFSYLGGETGFIAAMKELSERYGDPNYIAETYINRALNFKKIKSDDHVLLDDFGIFLSECLYAVNNIDAMKVLNYPKNIQTLLSKLPFYMHDKWRGFKDDIKGEPVSFKHFVKFVKKQAKRLNDPVYGRDAIASADNSMSQSQKDLKSKSKPVTGKVFNTSVTDVNSDGNKCKYCHFNNHSISECRKLAKLSRDDIVKFVSKEKLCFGCLKSGHQKSKCWNKQSCSKCKLRHPTILHSDSFNNSVDSNDSKDTSSISTDDSSTEQNNNDTSLSLETKINRVKACVSMEAGDDRFCTMPIIPTKVLHGCKTIDTYAFLDVGSSVCFCTEKLLDDLGIQGKKSKLILETMNSESTIEASVVEGLRVFSYNLKDSVCLPKCYSVPKIPVTVDHIPTTGDVMHYSHLRDVQVPEVECGIGLIIGSNIADAYTPLDLRIGPRGTPHATKTALGWVLWNVCRENSKSDSNVINRINIRAANESEHLAYLDRLVRTGLSLDFPDHSVYERQENSVLDNLFVDKVSKSIVKDKEGHYEIALPFKDANVLLPKNYDSALSRLESLRRKLSKNVKFRDDYVKFMNSVLEKGYAEPVLESELSVDRDKLWYIPHHGIYHKQKQKLRVVFDCSAKYQGISLNDVLLPGPDLANSLLGVLMRFRLGKIAFMADVEGMFHQVRVPVKDRCSLRFLWWPDGNLSSEVKEYQMTAHLFGAVSSPSCSNYALQQTARDNVDQFAKDAIHTLLNDFYVDDCLHSVDDENVAVNLVKNLTELCKLGGFRLHKWISNSNIVTDSIPIEERADYTNPTLGENDPVIERALGIIWEVSSDSITFKINISNKPFTRRGILSIVSAVYDPLGLVAPVLLPAKQLLQELCQSGLSWDEKIDDKQLVKWHTFLEALPLLENVKLPRCVKPKDIQNVVSVQLHNFSDASETGYGVASYIRFVDKYGVISCTLILGKSRVGPLKRVTIPRMELMAATISARLNSVIVENLGCHIDNVYFWTDSTTVLRYIKNEEARFKTFVANRVTVIRNLTDVNHWRYVSTRSNPADHASRGLSVQQLINSNWLTGPEFLCKSEQFWPDKVNDFDKLSDNIDDPEIKHSVVCAVIVKLDNPIDKLISYYSNWQRLVRAVTLLRLLFRKFANRIFKRNPSEILLSAEELECSKRLLIQREQFRYLGDIIEICENNSQSQNVKVLKAKSISKLDPFVSEGLLRVGGRLSRTNLDVDAKHPVLIPKVSPISNLIIIDAHSRVGHLGKNATLSEIRKTYWIIGAGILIKSILSKCVLCRKYSAKRLQQKMADLPLERVISGEAPFTRTGMDYFGPFAIKRGRSDVKRYGVIFTCLNSRAVHLEVANSLDTDSCINAIRRFVARRGMPKFIRSDNGTNLVGAQRELKQCIDNWNQNQISKELGQKGIQWEFNPPAASHFGGVWERLIRSVRKVLCALEHDQVHRLDDESLYTLLCEVEQILNNRPITKVPETPNDLDVLTPCHLLNGYNNSSYSPTLTDKTDSYAKRRWRRIQYLCNLFWKRWTQDYLTSLQERQKWLYPKRNISVDDIVLVIDNHIRNSWSLGRVIEVITDKNGLTRIATIKTQVATLKRPITKLSLVLECD